MPEAVKTVGRYEILRELGRGGMATVHLARQRDLDRLVALKELGAFHAADPSFAQRFVRESRVAGSLSHANIVTVHDYFEHDGTPYIAMEYVEGGSLRPWVGRMTLAQRTGVLEGVLAGRPVVGRRRPTRSVPSPPVGERSPSPGPAAGLSTGSPRPGGVSKTAWAGMRSARPKVLAGRSLSGGRRYTSRLASSGVLERTRPDLSGQSRPLSPGDCWICSTAGEPPFESDDLPELLSALVANSTTASPASTVATRMARQGRHPVRAAATGSSGKRASFSRGT